MLATLTDRAFSDDGWLYERKLDGVRVLVFRTGDRVRLRSRNRQDLNPAYPEIVEAVAAQPADDFVVDAEIVAFDGNRTSFSRLQGRMQLRDPEQARRSGIAVYCYLFDVLHVDGHDTTSLPALERKRVLRALVQFDDPLRFTAHRRGNGERFHEEACGRGWEGVIAKRADATYAHRRSRDWVKLKCVQRQEFVVGGYTDPMGQREELGALLVGYYADGELHYAGRVGTGYTRRMLRQLGSRLRSIGRRTSPFADAVPARQGVRWVSPELVVEVAFTEWTTDGQLRHPRFLVLRDDMNPGEVRREQPVRPAAT